MRNYSISKNKIICMVFVTILIMLTILIASVNISGVSAEALNENEIDAISKSMTSSINFIVNGEQKSVDDYSNYLHDRFQLDNKNYDVLNVEDEWIKNIVPEQLFKQKIEDYFYIGDEYGFYFNSNDDGTYLIYLIKHIIKYCSGNLERTIQPIYYENYVYNEQTEIVSLEYTQYVELCTSCNPCYFPSNHNISRCHYKKYSKYNKLYLKDVNYTANLYNENNLNVGEYGYDANVDNGGYFIANQYYFNGVSTQSGKGDFLIEAFKIGKGGDAGANGKGNSINPIYSKS